MGGIRGEKTPELLDIGLRPPNSPSHCPPRIRMAARVAIRAISAKAQLANIRPHLIDALRRDMVGESRAPEERGG